MVKQLNIYIQKKKGKNLKSHGTPYTKINWSYTLEWDIKSKTIKHLGEKKKNIGGNLCELMFKKIS